MEGKNINFPTRLLVTLPKVIKAGWWVVCGLRGGKVINNSQCRLVLENDSREGHKMGQYISMKIAISFVIAKTK